MKMKVVLLLSLVLSLFSGQTIAAEQDGPAIILLAYGEVKKGMGCIQAMAKTKFPISKQQCKKLLAEHGMRPIVDARNPMMQIEKEATVPVGTIILYYFASDQNGYTIADTD
jgi:hypothetical protein